MRAATVFAGLIAVAAAASHSSKGCVNKCWEYTKYVTSCSEDEGTQCLCDDSEYQNAVYQCLYSQCPTAHFANALHETLNKCAGSEDSHSFVRQNDLRIKRDAAYAPPAYGAPAESAPAYTPKASGSVTKSAPHASVTRSAAPYHGSPMASVSASGSAYTRTYATRASGSPYMSGSAAPTATSARAGGAAGTGGAGGAGATPTGKPLTGAAAAAPAGMGMLAAAGMALAVLA